MLGSYIDPRSSSFDHVTIDIETVDPLLKISGVSWIRDIGKILGIACKIGDAKSEYYPVGHGIGSYVYSDVQDYFMDLFGWCKEHSIPIVLHFAQYDLGWLDHEDFLDITWCPPIRCTLVMSQLYNSSMVSFSLDSMSRYFKLGQKIEIDINSLISIPIAKVAQYACNDLDLTDGLYRRLLTENLNQEAVERECDILPIIVMMKKQGIKVDLEYLERLEKEFNSILSESMKILLRYDSAININAGASIEMLFRSLKIGYPRTEHGNPSFTQEFLDHVGLSSPVVASLSKARKIKKLLTFISSIKTLQWNGVIHPDYWNGKSDWGGTVTGRFSCSNPNTQQMPNRTEKGKMIRGCFVPFDDAWGRADFSQQEPMLAMHYASLLHLLRIKELEELYKLNSYQDFYKFIQDNAQITRDAAKVFTLATMYGMGSKYAAQLLGIEDEEAIIQLSDFHKAVPWLKQLQNYVFDKVDRSHTIRTVGNRTLTFNHRESKSFNHLIQGSAADQIKQAMINVYRETSKIPLITFHDELGYSLRSDELEDGTCEKIKEIMQNAVKLQIPAKVDFTLGLNWKEACE